MFKRLDASHPCFRIIVQWYEYESTELFKRFRKVVSELESPPSCESTDSNSPSAHSAFSWPEIMAKLGQSTCVYSWLIEIALHMRKLQFYKQLQLWILPNLHTTSTENLKGDRACRSSVSSSWDAANSVRTSAALAMATAVSFLRHGARLYSENRWKHPILCEEVSQKESKRYDNIIYWYLSEMASPLTNLTNGKTLFPSQLYFLARFEPCLTALQQEVQEGSRPCSPRGFDLLGY